MSDFLNRFDTSGIECKLQFLLSKREFRLPFGFTLHKFNGVNFGIHDQQTIIKVHDGKGKIIGVILGLVVDLDKEAVVSNDITLEKGLPVKDIQAFLDNLAGSYVFVYLSDSDKRIYLDADGTMSLVFDAHRQIAGSTAAVILDEQEYFDRLRKELFVDLDVLDYGWFPSGLTAHQGVERLLCNFYLDLTTWESKRFWPIEPFTYSDNPQNDIAYIHDNTKKVLNALTKNRQVQQSLTAGYETRFLLSCSKDIRDRISFFTVDGMKMDMDIAMLLSKKFDLQHRGIPQKTTSEKQKQDWLFRAGHAVGGTNLFTHASISCFEQQTILSIGLGGEVGRGFLWKKGDKSEDEVSAQLIIGRFGIRANVEIIKRTALWLDTLPAGLDFFSILDLAYLELRMSAWAYAQSYAQDAILLHISPMISYRNYKAMFRISPKTKRENPIIISAISMNCPDLLEIPFNKYGDWRDVLALFSKMINPMKVKTKLRKIFAS